MIKRADVTSNNTKLVVRCVVYFHVAEWTAADKTLCVPVQLDVLDRLKAPVAPFRICHAARLHSLWRAWSEEHDIHPVVLFRGNVHLLLGRGFQNRLK